MQIQMLWLGPFSWPGFEHENKLPTVPSMPGIYLWTIEYEGGYLIYAAGITNNVPRRFKQNTDIFFAGGYTIFDIPAMERGIRIEIWHGAEWSGWRWAERPERKDEFATRRAEILTATKLQLLSFRVFVAEIGDRRIRERTEAAIMNCLYAASPPLCDLPDKGMRLAPGRAIEEPIAVLNVCRGKLYGLPETLGI